MIIRLMSGGLYRVSDELGRELDDLDSQAVQALEDGDALRLHDLIETIAWRTSERGERVYEAQLDSSELIIAPPDISLDEARDLYVGEDLTLELVPAGLFETVGGATDTLGRPMAI